MLHLRATFLTAAIVLAALQGAQAGIEDSRFTFGNDGTVDLELRAVSRRDVLERLFAGQTIKLEWLNRDVADEAVSGNFSGPRSDVVRQLLQQTNFILSHTTAHGVKQVSRVLVLGRATDGKAVVAAAGANPMSQQFQTASAVRPPMPDPKAGTGMAPVATPSKGADLKPMPRPGGAAPAPPLPGANTAQLAVPMPTNTGSGPMPMPMPMPMGRK